MMDSSLFSIAVVASIGLIETVIGAIIAASCEMKNSEKLLKRLAVVVCAILIICMFVAFQAVFLLVLRNYPPLVQDIGLIVYRTMVTSLCAALVIHSLLDDVINSKKNTQKETASQLPQ